MKVKPAAAVLGAFVACGVIAGAGATEIYKCVDDGGTAYQSVPCATGASEIRLARGPLAAAILAPSPRPEAQRRYGRKPGPWKHHVLTLGMSDDEVLNLPGWGRPARITRVRLPREWREEWVYDSGLLAEQRLYFANAKLVDIVAVPSEARVVGTAALPSDR